ncbi:hypothetical protein AMS68_007550 [Peltaster fructicola]|uniref:Uncharacterized protein n=1 Tax=Peltaster fructicola TaxID=286661 RepID=A0A6H0Y4V4_9PEZI|nr:hypothetical protein AMS68_007550 [Peltaster fructicola]
MLLQKAVMSEAETLVVTFYYWFMVPVAVLSLLFADTMYAGPGLKPVSAYTVLRDRVHAIDWSSPAIVNKTVLAVILLTCLLRAILACHGWSTNVADFVRELSSSSTPRKDAPARMPASMPGTWPDGKGNGVSAGTPPASLTAPPSPPPLPPAPSPASAPFPLKLALPSGSGLPWEINYERSRARALLQPKLEDYPRIRAEAAYWDGERKKLYAELAREEAERVAKEAAAQRAQEEAEKEARRVAEAAAEAERRVVEAAAEAVRRAAEAEAEAARQVAEEEARRVKAEGEAVAEEAQRPAPEVASVQEPPKDELEEARLAAEQMPDDSELGDDDLDEPVGDNEASRGTADVVQRVNDLVLFEPEPEGFYDSPEVQAGKEEEMQPTGFPSLLDLLDELMQIAVEGQDGPADNVCVDMAGDVLMLDAPSGEGMVTAPSKAVTVSSNFVTDEDGDVVMDDAAPTRAPSEKKPPPSAPKAPRCARPAGSSAPQGFSMAGY